VGIHGSSQVAIGILLIRRRNHGVSAVDPNLVTKGGGGSPISGRNVPLTDAQQNFYAGSNFQFLSLFHR
jgi:hypothetical protein